PPVPDSNESRYSTRGGATSSNPYVRYRSSRSRRSSSMRRASFGRISARLSGNNHLDIITALEKTPCKKTQTKSDLGRKPAKSLAEKGKQNLRGRRNDHSLE